jgi:hypothetical protein
MNATPAKNEARNRHVMPFGKHRGAPLTDVPTSYLAWVMRTCKLSTGLRSAMGEELRSRPDCPEDLPPEPAANTPPSCRGCGGTDLHLTWQPLGGAGGRVIRADCRGCGAFVYFAPQTPENVALADAGDEEPVPVPQAGEEFELRLLALPDHVPATGRLKQLLKTALRTYKLKCTSVVAVKPGVPS